MRHMNSRIARMGTTCLLTGSLVFSLAACGATPKSAKESSESAVQTVLIDESASDAATSDTTAADTTASTTKDTTTSLAAMSSTGVISTADLFTERDLAQVADTSAAKKITVQSGQDVQITQEGVYVLTGEAQDVTITVEAPDDAKVQLVLDGLTITNEDVPAIYVKSADKVFVTTVEGTSSTLAVTGTFVADGDTNTDAVVFSKDDLVLNGLGTLVVNSTDNGVTSKDDLKVTGGTYQITATDNGLEAHDSILVADGSLSITSSAKDGLHTEDDEDDTTGLVYICGGTFSINAADDGIHATTYLQVDGGMLDISAAEALEATYVQVNGGDLKVAATDDGVNATYKSQSVGTPTIEVTGGTLAVTMGSGDTDALDANGNIVVSGGQIDISAQFAFDFDGAASFTGGTITVNGEQVSEITNSMMGGMGGGPMGGGQMGEMPEGGMGPGGGMGHGGGPRGGSDTNGQATELVTGDTYSG